MTANVARDMDLIRAALGEPKISYLGGSCAAALGAVHASMFASRVDWLAGAHWNGAANACMSGAVTAMLAQGWLPAGDLTC